MTTISQNSVKGYNQPLNSGWLAKQANLKNDDGANISSPDYSTQGWMPAIVPGTVLNTLIHNDVYKDPYFGTNYWDIPDISGHYLPNSCDNDVPDEDVPSYTYWFRTSFNLPTLDSDTRIWLNLRGINYTAQLYLNGQAIDIGYPQPPPINTITGEPLQPNEIQGMFLRHEIDITEQAKPGEENVLAICVEPPNPPGRPGGNGGYDYPNVNIGKNVTMRYTVGWDWVIPIPDRNTGIWDHISICTTGPVRIQHPQVITQVLDEDANLQNNATLTISAEVQNTSDQQITGTLSYILEETGQKGSQSITLSPFKPGDKPKMISFPKLQVTDPKLWWPNGYGDHPLYNLKFTFDINDQGPSDSQSIRFGIREIRVDYLNVSGQDSRQFSINGQPIFIRGANWIGTDAMLRPQFLSAQRYRDEVHMFADTNLNLLRVWGGGIAERPEFYAACDEYGLLVMQDFWISGEYQGPYPNGYAELFLSCARDTIYMLRNHPSLCFWSGGNESEPPPEILTALQSYITGQTHPNDEASSQPTSEALDPTRILIPRSTMLGNNDQRQYNDGPYGILDPKDFFTGANNNPFNPEVGSVGTPVIETMQAMMSSEDYNQLPSVKYDGKSYRTINGTWYLHDYIPYKLTSQPNHMSPYTYPKDIEHFCDLAQILNYEQYRALFEGYTSQMWQKYTGVIMWKGQNPWLGLRGQFYDWLLDQTGGLFGARKACEPIHVQLNLDDYSFCVVNTTTPNLTDVTVTATFFDEKGKLIPKSQLPNPQIHTYDKIPAHHLSKRIQLTLPKLPIYFLQLELHKQDSSLLSKNFYWLSENSPPAFKNLKTPLSTHLEGNIEVEQEKANYSIKATIKNPADEGVAFFLRLQTRKDQVNPGEDYRVLPTYYDDNYFSLLPGETRTLTLHCAIDDAGGTSPQVWIEGWNVQLQRLYEAT